MCIWLNTMLLPFVNSRTKVTPVNSKKIFRKSTLDFIRNSWIEASHFKSFFLLWYLSRNIIRIVVKRWIVISSILYICRIVWNRYGSFVVIRLVLEFKVVKLGFKLLKGNIIGKLHLISLWINEYNRLCFPDLKLISIDLYLCYSKMYAYVIKKFPGKCCDEREKLTSS